MADEVTTPVATVEGEAPAEAEKPADGAPVEGAAATEKPAEIEKTPEEIEAAAAAQKAADADFMAKLPELLKKIPEADQRRLGLQFANRTMAAARRAEKAAQSLATENAQLKARVAEGGNAPDIRKDVGGWMKANGFTSAKALVEHLIAAGGEPKKADPLDEIAQLRKEREQEKAEAEANRIAQIDAASRVAVAAALKARPEMHYVSKPSGVARLWGEIVEYRKVHGECPDAAVFHLAGDIEREMRAEFGEPARPAAKVTTPAGAAKPAGSADGGDAATITGKGAGGAPVVREYSMDLEIRRQQVNEDMIASGQLKRA